MRRRKIAVPPLAVFNSENGLWGKVVGSTPMALLPDCRSTAGWSGFFCQPDTACDADGQIG